MIKTISDNDRIRWNRRAKWSINQVSKLNVQKIQIFGSDPKLTATGASETHGPMRSVVEAWSPFSFSFFFPSRLINYNVTEPLTLQPKRHIKK